MVASELRQKVFHEVGGYYNDAVAEPDAAGDNLLSET